MLMLLTIISIKCTANGLATRGSSSFIFNPPIPEAIELQNWCMQNAETIKELVNDKPQLVKAKPPADDNIVKIENLPATAAEMKFFGFKGVARLDNFHQPFYYLACSLCKKGTNDTDEDTIWCNFCEKTVPTLKRIKFDIELSDASGKIKATIFAEAAENFYDITPEEIVANKIEDTLEMPLLQKLSAPRNCTANITTYDNSSAGINECRFTITSIFHIDAPCITDADELLALPPNTPNKKAKKESSNPSSSSTKQPSFTPLENITMEDQEASDNTKKND